MSRIGKSSIILPAGVKVSELGKEIAIHGPKGELRLPLFPTLTLEITETEVKITRKNDEDKTKALHGLLRSLVANAVVGVTSGFEKRLELVGTGYRAKKEGAKLVLSLGFSHPVIIEPVAGINFELEGDKDIIISGIDKQLVGQVSANIRAFRKPEPYKGKGIRYKGEIVRRKPGKAAKVGSAGGA